MSVSFQNQFVAGFIAGHATELAGLAARRLLDRFPHIENRYRPVPYLKWKDNYTVRLTDLSASIAAATPSIFAEQIAWNRAAFIARNVPPEDLSSSLLVLRELVGQQLPPGDSAILEPYFDAGDLAARTHIASEAVSIDPGTPEGQVGGRYLLAILEGQRLAASRIILDAVDAGIPVRRVYTHILIPVQRQLGRMWHACEINVAEEHFATATTAAVMAQLQPLILHPEPDGRTLLAVCVEGDLHDLGLRMLADFFEMDAWRVVCLGASVPAPDTAAAAAFFSADLVAISASLPAHLERVAETIQLIRASTPHARILLGGRIFQTAPNLWQTFGADAYAPSIEEALRIASNLVPPPAA